MRLVQLDKHNTLFPPVENALAQPNGLLAFGGDLSCERLQAAYQQGIFPWFSPQEPILWWSPDPRAVLFPNELHISRSMIKFMRKTRWHCTLNHAFTQVITACTEHRDDNCWIDGTIQQAYCHLHQLGLAHSVEVWQQEKLIGGLYGVAQGSLFCGESMFSRVANASKVALFTFCDHFVQHGGILIDSQIINPHTASLGVREISRNHYLDYLYRHQHDVLAAGCWLPQALPSLDVSIRNQQSDKMGMK